MALERTLSIIKPNAVEDAHIGEIITRFEREGFKIVGMKFTQPSKEKLEGFYIEHRERPFFPSLINFMAFAPVVLIVLEGEDVVSRNRELMGATNPEEACEGSLRKLYARSLEANAVHGSDSIQSAEREISYFFDKSEIFSTFS